MPPKPHESQLWEYRDSHLGVPGHKTIWMWPPWRATEYTISLCHGESYVSELLVVRPNTKSAPTMHEPLCAGFV